MSLRAIAEEEIPALDASRFEIIERIGSGGMAVVYKAIQKSVGRPVAVKVLTPEPGAEDSSVARFVREASVISKLTHPNIVSMIDFGRDKNGNMLLVMELLEGESIRQTLKRLKKLAPGRAVYIAQQILSALRAAHASGVIHRDLKPENIFLTRVDGVEHVKVLDFGVAKSLEADESDQTTMGALVGTLRYMAPEQMSGEVPDGRADVFALGVILYEMLSGAMPFEGSDRFQLLRAVLKEPPTPLNHKAPELSPALVAVVMRALAKSPNDRWGSAEELRKALAPFALASVTQELPAVGGPAAPVPAGITMASGSMQLPQKHASGPLAAPKHSSGPIAAPKHSSGPMVVPHASGPMRAPVAPVATPTSNNATSSSTGVIPTQNTLDAPSASSLPAWSTLAGIGVGVLCFAAAAGILISRWHSAETPTANASASATASVLPSATARAPIPGTVLVRSNPPGAVVADARSGVPLCRATPCAVPLLQGSLPRAITLRLDLRFAAAVLAPGMSSLDVVLSAPPATPSATSAASAPPPRHRSPGLRLNR